MGTQLIRWDGMISMVTGGLLLVWWILVASLVPSIDPTVGLLDVVSKSAWLPFSLPGMVAAILLPGVIVSLYFAQKGMVSKVGQAGFYLSLLGAVMFAWVQIEQTLVWPRLVEEAPHLVDYSLPLFGDVQFDFIYWPAHLLLGIGLLLFGRATVKAGVFPGGRPPTVVRRPDVRDQWNRAGTAIPRGAHTRAGAHMDGLSPVAGPRDRY